MYTIDSFLWSLLWAEHKVPHELFPYVSVLARSAYWSLRKWITRDTSQVETCVGGWKTHPSSMSHDRGERKFQASKENMFSFRARFAA